MRHERWIRLFFYCLMSTAAYLGTMWTYHRWPDVMVALLGLYVMQNTMDIERLRP